jgi:hypothetical protein
MSDGKRKPFLWYLVEAKCRRLFSGRESFVSAQMSLGGKWKFIGGRSGFQSEH